MPSTVPARQRTLGLIAGTIIACLPASAQTSFGPELISNTDFEQNTSPWFGFGTTDISRVGSPVFDGDFSLHVTDRTDNYNGPAIQMPTTITDGTYDISAWVRVESPGQHGVQLTLRKMDASGTSYRQAANFQVEGGEWVQVRGWHDIDVVGTLNDLLLYIEGPNPGVNYTVDNISFKRVNFDTDWRTDADARIEQIRKGDAVIRVVDTQGNPVTGADVSAAQTAKAYPFGCVIAAGQLNNPNYTSFYNEIFHFNYGVAENAMKWQSTHPFPGADFYGNADAILAFCQANGIPLRGHAIFWAVQQRVPDWVQGLSDGLLNSAVIQRVSEMVGRYAGQITHWDVNNEMIHGDYFAARLGNEVRVDMFNLTKAADPNVLTFVNDYNIISGGEFIEYNSHIQQLEQAGATIDGIGVQGHFQFPVDTPMVLAKLDLLAELGKPIWVTEFDAELANDNARADSLENFYRAVYSHPAVDGILMWGFWEGSHWRPNAAIVDLDWTINEAGQRYLDLMDEWSTEYAGQTEASGDAAFRGFHGDYGYEVSHNGQTYSGTFTISKDATGPEIVTVVVPAAHCAADVNGDGNASPADFTAWLGCFNNPASAPYCGNADVNSDGSVTPADFTAWLAAFNNGCP